MSKPKVCIIDGDILYKGLFVYCGFEVVSKLEDADLVCFTGGEDVDPSYYNEPKHPTTHSNPIRDAREKTAFDIATDLGIPKVGICRGGQFLNVMSGGSMYQDCSNHTRPHHLLDEQSGEVLLVSSTHHQMMRPSDNAIIVASAKENGTRTYYDKTHGWVEEASEEDYEVLYYEGTDSLCFQPHPEFTQEQFKDLREYFKELITGFFKS